MGGGGKGGTTTQTVSIPPEVLARYNAVNARAEDVAKQPFQAYPGQFVAPLTGTQQAGVANINQAAGMAQPYFGAAAGLTAAGSQAVGPLTQQQIQYYQNPFTQAVVDPTIAAMQQEFGQQRAQQQASAIRAGAFGGDRAGLERANLMRQQGLGMAQAIAPLYSQGYGMGVQTAAGQQGVVAQDLQRQLAAGQQFAGLGAGAQQAALQGAQAQLGAGTLEQQTQQADLTARYQQFLQERGYPFQVAQFLANIAMGTGALSGSTTTTTQPTSFFSDERMKENVRPIGETFDGQTIYKYNYKGEPGTQIGLIAQEVEQRKPEAVGMAGGMKTVDYDRATEEAGGIGKALASMGGAVREPGAYARGGYAPGGLVDPNDIQALLASQKAAFGPFAQGGPYGQTSEQTPFSGAGGIVPTSRLPTPKLMTAGPAPRQQEGGLRSAMQDIAQAGKVTEKLGTGLDKLGKLGMDEEALKAATDPSFGQKMSEAGKSLYDTFSIFQRKDGGGVRPHYAAGGAGINPYGSKNDPMDYFPEEVLESGSDKTEALKPAPAPSGGGGSGFGVGDAVKIAATVLPMFMSDRRLKHDVEPIGKTYDGQNIYRYHMGDGAMRMGLMAQEVAQRKPEAVGRGPGGFLTLDYDRATEEASAPRGGVMPREGLQEGGVPSEEPFDIIKRYWPNVERTESGGKQFDPKTGQPLTSSAGAIGVAQVMPKTAPEAARLAGVEFDENRYRTDPDYNRSLGQAYLREQYRVFGDPALALAAYNAGPGNVRAALAKAQESGGSFVNYLPAETQQYLVKTGAMPGVARSQTAGVKPFSDFLGGPPIRFGTKTAQNPQGEQFKSYGDFFTSRQFIQPALVGLATMASSPSRYLGSAILQGLGGASGAYSDLEKQMADVAGTQAKTQETTARTGFTEAQTSLTGAQEIEALVRSAGASFKELNGRVQILVVNKKTGQAEYVDYFSTYKANPNAYQIVGKGGGGLGAGAAAAPGAAASGAAGTRAASADTIAYPGVKPIAVERRELPPLAGAETTPGAGAGTTAPGAPVGGIKPPTATGPFALTPNVLDTASREAVERPNLPDATLQDRPDLLVNQTKVAEGAETVKPTLIQIGILGSTPRTGMTAQGPLQPVLTELASLGNDVATRLFGAGAAPFNKDDIASYESWQKKLNELSAAAAKAGDQTAVESLKRLRELYPAPNQTPGGFAKNLAELMVVNQKDIQKAKFYADYSRLAQGADTRLPGRIDPATARLFEQEYGGIFEAHRAALERMLRADDPRFLPRDEQQRLILDKNGRPMSWFTYLQTNGSKLTPGQVADVERAFKAPGIMEYFRTGMGAQ